MNAVGEAEIWTQLAASIFFADNCYVTCAFVITVYIHQLNLHSEIWQNQTSFDLCY